MSDDTPDGPIVWILGAGFSIPLGGPPFAEVISWGTLEALKSWDAYDAHPLPGGVQPSHWAEAVVFVYRAGLQPGYRLWKDAEQFLDVLDFFQYRERSHLKDLVVIMAHNIAAADILTESGSLPDEGVPRNVSSAAKPLLQRLDLERLRLEAIRFVAGATSHFLVAAEQESTFIEFSELWEPYLRWAKLLQSWDTVLSFNYDRVLRLLEKGANTATPTSPLPEHPLEFQVPSLPRRDANSKVVHECPLHGRVDWELESDPDRPAKGDKIITRGHIVAFKDPDKALFATPGFAKRLHSEGALAPIWKHALRSIEHAKAIVIVGYRFPQTDNYAKLQLHEVLAKNVHKAPVHVVIGPANKEAERVSGMLKWSLPVTDSKVYSRVVVHEMYAEDFLAVFNRRRIFNMHKGG